MNTTSNPRVSVIMPAFNAAETIRDSIDSVLNQTFKNWELIIIDDCSRDKTCEIVQSYANTQMKLLRQVEHKGISAARNAGARAASGEYIAFLDSDDLWLPRKLEIQIQYHTANPSYLISHTAFTAFYGNKKGSRLWRQKLVRANRKRGDLLPLLYYNTIVATLTVMMRRSLFMDIGGFDGEIQGCEDLDLWIRIAQKGSQFGYINEILARYRNNPGGISKDVSKYRRTVRKYIREKIIASTVVPPSVKKRALAGYYLMFGRLYEKKGDLNLARKYYIASLKQLPADLFICIATIIFLIASVIRNLLAKMLH
jgi:glycosyltransferase involved in cell wall biosynthesis